MCDWIALAGLVVQILIFSGLIWYAYETQEIRKTSQEQIATSQEQIEISQEQNEIMQKPCLVPSVQENESRVDATLWSNERVLLGTSGNTGCVVLQNIGHSPSFNIQYGIQGKNPEGFLPYILKQGKERTTLSLNQLRDWFCSNQDEEEVKLSLSYDSLSGRRYESTIIIREGLRPNLVVTKCQFKEITSNPHRRRGSGL